MQLSGVELDTKITDALNREAALNILLQIIPCSVHHHAETFLEPSRRSIDTANPSGREQNLN